LKVIDGSRSPEYPDDVMVVLIYGENQPQVCWVRREELGKGPIKGVLFNEANADFKVHFGDMVEFEVMKNDNRLMYVAVIK